MKIKNLFSFCIVFNCLIFFFLTSFIYIYSMSLGYEGLAIPLFKGGDDRFYYEQALNIAYGRPADLTSIHAVVLGGILNLFQTDDVFVLRAFNFIGNILILFVGLKSLFLLQMANRNLTAGIIFVAILSYYPSYLMNSNGSIIRDCWIIFYYLLSILMLLKILQSREFYLKVINTIILLLSLLLLVGYREYALLSFLASAVIYFLLFERKQPLKNGKKIFVYVFFVFTIMYTFLKSFKFPIINLSIEDILEYRAVNIELYAGGSQMYISLDQTNVFLFYTNYLYSIFSNALGPFPWQFTGISSMILFFTESLLLFFISYKIYKLRWMLSKYDYFLIINSVIWFMLIGIFNDNIGAAARLRIVGWFPLVLVFSKVYGEHIVSKKSFREIKRITRQNLN
ncbi:hypothetical protein WAX74_12895 [Psychrobacillus sp. FJAT-51614]|uniref:Glycosyltransferase RgtA/B/C/D-like domain-containing protein n=1 Tax=Psychrobacillus mangrovi TaxID=3117745 RepID=A0ABU8F688_9BACI